MDKTYSNGIFVYGTTALAQKHEKTNNHTLCRASNLSYCWNMPMKPPSFSCSLMNISKYWKMIVTAKRIPVPEPMAPMKSARRQDT